MRNFVVYWQVVVLLGTVAVRSPGIDASLGVKAGVGFPFYSGNGYSSALGGLAHTGFRLGYSFGIAGTLQTAKATFYQVEILYSRVGGNWGDVYATHYDEASIIDTPLIIGLRRRFGRSQICPYAGVGLQWRAGESSYRIVDADGFLLLSDIYQNSLLRPVLLGAVLGVGIRVPVRVGILIAETRCCLGLISRFTLGSSVRNWRQNNLQVLVGYQVPFKKSNRP